MHCKQSTIDMSNPPNQDKQPACSPVEEPKSPQSWSSKGKPTIDSGNTTGKELLQGNSFDMKKWQNEFYTSISGVSAVPLVSPRKFQLKLNAEQKELPNLNEKDKWLKISVLCDLIGGVYHAATADVNFILEIDANGNEEVIPAHKCILASQSPVFRQMFYGELKECGDIKLTDTTIDAFVDFLQCIYARMYIDGEKTEVSQLLHLAHKYDVDWLEKKCKKILDEVIDNNIRAILWVFPLAHLYSYDDLKVKCIGLICSNANLLIESPEFADCELEVMKLLLSLGKWDHNKVKLFEMCIRWAKRACEKADLDPETPENIRTHFHGCFELIPFNSMTHEQFMQCLSINPKVFTYDEIQQITSTITGFTPTPGEPNKPSKLEQFDLASPFLETKKISTHKCILARRCEAFGNLFEYNSSQEINIVGVSVDDFSAFLRLIYTYSYEQRKTIMEQIDDQNIGTILSLGIEYKAFGIMRSYTLHLSEVLTVQNVIRTFELARTFSLATLVFECIDLMKKNGAQVIRSDAFLGCSQPIFKAILELRIWKFGNSLIDGCVKWAKKKCQKNHLDFKNSKCLRDSFGDAFELIPFSSMDPLKFIYFQRNYGDLFTGDELRKVLNEMADRR